VSTKRKSSQGGPIQKSAADATENERQLQRLKRRIATLEKRLAASEAKTNDYREHLRILVASMHPREEIGRIMEDETDWQTFDQFLVSQ
jgi:predicted RNase H-like nuclease (RuvC/YqgF family)